MSLQMQTLFFVILFIEAPLLITEAQGKLWDISNISVYESVIKPSQVHEKIIKILEWPHMLIITKHTSCTDCHQE